MKLRHICAVAAFASSAAAWAQTTVTSATATPTGKDRARVVATITVSRDDQLVGCSTPIAKMCDVHTVARGGAAMAHRPIALKAGKPRTLSVHGDHLMPMGVVGGVSASFPMTLAFAHSAPVTITVRTH